MDARSQERVGTVRGRLQGLSHFNKLFLVLRHLPISGTPTDRLNRLTLRHPPFYVVPNDKAPLALMVAW